ncbi:MAG: PilT/PilU family type 4a pilus ATPase [Candidatus Omnitrophota bacterium]
MLTFDNNERRKSFRVPCSMPVTCKVFDRRGSYFKTKVAEAKNISCEGIYLEIDENLPLDTEIEISFNLPQVKDVINAVAKIVRTEISNTKGQFGIGLMFSRLSSENGVQIKQMLERLNINKLLGCIIEKGGSDLHLLAERHPFVRVSGEVQPLDWPKLSSQDIDNLLFSLMTREQISRFETDKELDFAVQYDMLNRFRINVHKQKGFTEAALRLINTNISSFKELNLPEVIEDLASLKTGLIIVAGPTGSGKTTTIAAMVQFISEKRKSVIITLERPIEYVYKGGKSIVKQREVGIDTRSFSAALKSTLRQDPNVIVVGELDDIETIKTAIIAAEAGYLVIASFHAPNTIQALDRLVGVFPGDNRKQVLSQLSHCLKGIITQLLIPLKDKSGRILVAEVLVVTEAAKRIIRNDELIQIPNVIQTGTQYKMRTMSDSINRCIEQDIIDLVTAEFYSDEFNKYTH